MPQQIDYDSLASQFGGAPTPAAAAPAAGVDYAALASEFGGQPAPAAAPSLGSRLASELEAKPGQIAQAGKDVVTGALKGAGSTINNLGYYFSKIPGLTAAGNALGGAAGKLLYGQEAAPVTEQQAYDAAKTATTASNTAQSLGKAAEQVGEVLVPQSAVGAAGKGLSLAGRIGLEGAANAGVGAAQGGSPLVAGAIGALAPGVGALAEKAAPALREQAEKQVMEALGPTKERFKAMAERLTPEILKRGLRGSREALAAQAGDAAEAAGQQIDDAIQQFGDRQVGTRPILSALEEAKNAFRTVTQQPLSQINPSTGAKVLGVDAKGVADVLHEFEPRAIRQLEGLQSVIEGLGPDARADQLIAVRRAWDKIVDQAGGFAHRAGGAIGQPLADASEASAKREATTAIRKQLDAAVPELSALNKEFAFWKSLDDVLTQTMKRTQPHKPGIISAMAERTGNVVGGIVGATHGPAGATGGAVAGGKASKALQMAFRSPRWKLASAQAKDAIASGIVSGDYNKVLMQIARITATQGSKIGQ